MGINETLSDSGKKHNLPRRVEFVGRQRELDWISGQLHQSTRAWIVSLTGIGGIGKSELAIQAAYQALESGSFERAIWTSAKESWLTSSGVQYRRSNDFLVSLNDLLDTIIEVLELDPRLYRVDVEHKKSSISEALRVRACLIIVDNLETIEDRDIIHFLETLPQPSKAIVTTRLGLLSGGAVAQTPAGQKELRIGPLEEEDALNLLIARAEMHGLSLPVENGDKLRKAVKKMAGIPLAIEWVVGHMLNSRQELDVSLSMLSNVEGEVLRYCFDSLISAVGKSAEKVLLAVPIFSKSASLEGLAYLTGMSRERLGNSLRKLSSASLVELEQDGRYSVLDPTRMYINSLWSRYPDIQEEYFNRAAGFLHQQLQMMASQQDWRGIEKEYHNALGVFNWCFDQGKFESVSDLAYAMSYSLRRLGLWDQQIYILDQAAVAAANLGRQSDAIHFTFESAEIHKQRGRLYEALDEFVRCEQYSSEHGERSMAAKARMQQGVIYYHLGRYSEASSNLWASLELYRADSDRLGEAICLTNLGRTEKKLGNSEKAKSYFENGLEIKRGLQDELGEAISLYDLASIYHTQGDLLAAQQYLDNSISLLQKLGERRHLANAKWYAALLKIDCHELEAARSLLLDALRIEETLQRRPQIERAEAKLKHIERVLAGEKQSLEGLGAAFAKKHVLIIGIEHFEELPLINGMAGDAVALGAVLSRSKRQETSLIVLQKGVKSQSVRDELKALAERSTNEDGIILSFGTHAVGINGRTYLCASDSVLNDLETTAISVLELVALVRVIPARYRVIFLDCQHELQEHARTGGTSKPKDLKIGFSASDLEFLSNSGNAWVVTAANGQEISHRFAQMEYGLFTAYLLEGIEGKAGVRGDGTIHLQDLFFFIQENIEKRTREQHPRLYSPIRNGSPVITVTNLLDNGPGLRSEDERSQHPFFEGEEIGKIREVIINDLSAGAKQLSAFLEHRNSELRLVVDTHRSEITRILQEQEKYALLQPEQEIELLKRRYHLLQVCQQLIDDIASKADEQA